MYFAKLKNLRDLSQRILKISFYPYICTIIKEAISDMSFFDLLVHQYTSYAKSN